FDLLLSALYLLRRVEGDSHLDVIVHSFELQLLSERGYHPALDHCVKCMQPVTGARLAFSPELGGVLCAMDRFDADDAIAISGQTIGLMHRLLGAEPDELVNLTAPPGDLTQTARCLKWYIRHRIDREVHSVEFLEMLRAGDRV